MYPLFPQSVAFRTRGNKGLGSQNPHLGGFGHTFSQIGSPKGVPGGHHKGVEILVTFYGIPGVTQNPEYGGSGRGLGRFDGPNQLPLITITGQESVNT